MASIHEALGGAEHRYYEGNAGRTGSHEGGFSGARRAGAAARVDGAVATGPIVEAVADSVVAACAVAGAIVQAAPLLDGGQVVRQLVDAHGVVDRRPPHTLHACSTRLTSS